MTMSACGTPDIMATKPTHEDTNPSTDPVVTDPPKPFALERDELTLVTEGETWVLYDGDVSAVTFSSEDENVATFIDGVVTAVGKGTTTVSASYNGQILSCTVYCNLREIPTTDAPTEPPATDAPKNPNAGSRDPVLLAPTTELVGGSFFDDAVFVGDSVSLKLSYYAGSSGDLGKAKFLVRGSYGVANGAFDYLLLTWQGKEMKIEDAVAATEAKKLFIMLGMNDVALYGVEKTIEHWGILLDRIRSKCPDITIYIQSMTPIWTGGEVGDLNNKNVDAYNKALKVFAAENNCKFIDIAPYMKDSTGGLATSFCSDEYVHFTDAGCDTWIKVLKAYPGY